MTFARAPQKTERRPIDDGGTMMTDVAKLGFYTFNVDVYIDTDGKPGSGNTRMLPGRNVEVDPANGWEKAICLTPLPEQAGTLLRRIYAEAERNEAKETQTETGLLTAEQKKEIKEEVGQQVTESVFFPTVVEIRGRLVRFFVPNTFLGGPAKADWGYVVASSGAAVTGRYDLVKLAGLKPDAPMEPLFIMRTAPGRTENSFGGADEDDPAPPALIDVLVPPGRDDAGEAPPERQPEEGRPGEAPRRRPFEARGPGHEVGPFPYRPERGARLACPAFARQALASRLRRLP